MTFEFQVNQVKTWGSKYDQVTLKRNDDDEPVVYQRINTSSDKDDFYTQTQRTIDVLELLQKYSTGDSPEINQKELWEIYDQLYKNNNDTVLYNSHATQVLSAQMQKTTYTDASKTIEVFEKVAEHYSNEFSPDGENINENEIYDMAELILAWTGFEKVED